MEMRPRLKKVLVATAALLSCGVLLWLTVGREAEPSVPVLGRQCLGEGGEQCVYHCDHGDTDCVDYVTRLERYCHYSLLTSSEGAEGNISGTQDTESLELVHVHVLARHGDRTPAYAYQVNPPAQAYECGLVNGDPKWLGLADFKAVSLHSSVRNSREPILPSSPKKCGYGHLTQTGYKQEYALGSLMRRKYSRRLVDVGPGEMYVQSTDYPRTIHSAAAFLLGFLPNDSHIRKSIVIHISPLSVTYVPPVGINKTYRYCTNYRKTIWNKELKITGYLTGVKERFQALIAKFCHMFDIKGANQPIASRLVDHLFVRGCHLPNDPLPCNSKGQCVDYSFAKQLTIAADWAWGHKFPRNSSLLAMLPFLKHSVFDVMENVVQGKPPAYKVLLTFTHDDVIIKLRSILGIFSPEWVPYASRLVFELWQTRGSQPVDYIRVLFNGRAITNAIKVLSARTEFEVKHNLITLSALRDHIMTDTLADVHTYHRLCLK